MFLLFEELLDKLAQEAKGAPGWVLVIVACALMPFEFIVPWYPWIADVLGEEAKKERSTVATLIAVTLFFIGDGLDTIIFPREKSRNRAGKLLQIAMLILGSWGLLLLLLKQWLAAGICWIVWTIALFIPLNRSKSEMETGWPWLHWWLGARLGQAQSSAKSGLGIDSGIYAVSKALVRAARQYEGRIMIQNESAKFVRTAVFPLILWAAWFGVRAERTYLALAIASAFLTLFLYSWLKTRHMCLLYETAATLPDSPCYQAKTLTEGVRVFLWKENDGYALVASGQVPVADATIVEMSPSGG